jgi:hypothetical protein
MSASGPRILGFPIPNVQQDATARLRFELLLQLKCTVGTEKRDAGDSLLEPVW